MILDLALLAIALCGHLALCIALVNRVHAMPIPKLATAGLSLLCWSTLLLAPISLFPSPYPTAIAAIRAGQYAPLVYLIPAWSLAAWTVFVVFAKRFGRDASCASLLDDQTRVIDLTESLGKRLTRGRATHALAKLPGNELLHLHIHEKILQLPRLHPGLSGLSIAHLSDLHMSGKLDRAFYEEIVDRTNDLSADLIVITGDLFDKDECLGWIPDTLARLRARGGVYFILGNHDLRVDWRRARRELSDAGLVDMGSRRCELAWQGHTLLLAGNELPWFLPAADMSDCPAETASGRALRILLSHTPDQIEWARRYDFDLMLAGHTHGGQVRLPLIGPVLAPSRMGTRFASGTFYLEPTLLHVSRGISSLTPLRWNCAPELAMLVLRSGSEVSPALVGMQGASV